MQYRQKRLTRSSRERLWAGVAGGMAEYFDVDPVIMRIIWVAAGVLTGGLAVPAYIVMWLIMPRDERAAEGWRPPAPPSGVVQSGGPGREGSVGSAGDAWGAAPREGGSASAAEESAGAPRAPWSEPVTYTSAAPPPTDEGGFAEPAASPPPGRGLTPEEEELLRPVAPPSEMVTVDDPGRKRRAAGVLLIGLGTMFFAQQLGIFLPVRWDLLWPLAIVGLGIFILTRHGHGAGWRH